MRGKEIEAAEVALSLLRIGIPLCPSSYKMGHQSGLRFGGSGSSSWLTMQPASEVHSLISLRVWRVMKLSSGSVSLT